MTPGDDTHTYGRVAIGAGTVLGHFVVLGYPDAPRLRQAQTSGTPLEDSLQDVAPTEIGSSCIIGSNVVIHEGATIGSSSFLDDFCRIGARARIGHRTRVIYRADVRHDAVVGDDCIIGGFVCDRAEVGSESTVLGSLVHKLERPDLPWGVEERSPVIHSRAVVGLGAIVVGGVEVGENAYIAAGAVVTKDVPPETLAIRYDELIPHAGWGGAFREAHFWSWRGRGRVNDGS